MKIFRDKKTFIILLGVIGLGLYFKLKTNSPHKIPQLKIVTLSNDLNECTEPSKLNLGLWSGCPTSNFHLQFVAKIPYIKAPPTQLLKVIRFQNLEQPVSIEFFGSFTSTDRKKPGEWKKCLTTDDCFHQSNTLQDYLKKWNPDPIQNLVWIERQSDSIFPLQGLRFQSQNGSRIRTQYLLINEEGTFIPIRIEIQNELTTQSPLVQELEQMIEQGKILNDLSESKRVAEAKVRNIQLKDLLSISETASRFSALYQADLDLISLLSTGASNPSPFFHLSGITHLWTSHLLKDKNLRDKNGVRISEGIKRMEVILSFLRDYSNSEPLQKQTELLYQDLLLLEKNSVRQ